MYFVAGIRPEVRERFAVRVPIISAPNCESMEQAMVIGARMYRDGAANVVINYCRPGDMPSELNRVRGAEWAARVLASRPQ